MSVKIREAAVAGQFYPENAAQLKADILMYLENARGDGGAVPKALIVPHAGYCYSGVIAAAGYKLLLSSADSIKRVVLLGPAHRLPFRGLALTESSAYRTPLGLVPLDRGALQLLGDMPQVVVLDEAHGPEHSLEVQVPFLQVCLHDFNLIPIVVGDATDRDVAEVLVRMWGGDETLVVVSSDLSHYLPLNDARRIDEMSRDAIEQLIAEDLSSEQACGSVPVRGLLRKAKECGMRVNTLDLRNSSDTGGPRDHVVGYGSFAFYE